MKKILSFVLILFSFSIGVSSLYFSDVPQNAWYGDYVNKVSDEGIITGVGDNKFDPDGDFTVAQCLAVASRIHAGGNEIEKTDGSWYSPYVDYCIKNGIIKPEDFDSYTRAVTRKEAAVIFSACLSGQELLPINDIKGIADIPRDDDGYGAVLSLYNAGVLSGSDEAGAFLPQSTIKRSELSAIAARLVDKNLRVKKELPYYGSPRYLIEDIIMYGPDSSIMSGWKMDNKYRTANVTGTDSNTISADFGQKNRIYRPINKIDEGNFRVDVMATFLMTQSGAYVSLNDQKNDMAVEVYAENNEFVIKSGEYTKKTGLVIDRSISEHAFTFDFSFENKLGFIAIDGKTFDNIPFAADDISYLSLGFDGSGRGAITLGHARCVADFRVNENFLATEKNENTSLYGNWKTEGKVTLNQMLSERGEDVYSARMKGQAKAEISYEKIGGKAAVEVNVLLPNANTPLRITTDAFEIYSESGAFYYQNNYLRHVAGNVWTNIRMEMDFVKNEAFVRINGKDCGVHSMNGARFIDGFLIENGGNGEVWFDDVKVFSIYDYEDYPGVPEAVNEGGYNIGVNVCNLWRNGNCGEGYDAVAPFEELYPYIGLADEGLAELADWEIKQMAEHGIDFQHVCWYSPQNDTKAPIKGTQMPQIALNDGYLKAKYGDYVKFCIMWENANGSVTGEQEFKDYIWRYFKEYYFSDSRYYSINNHAVMTIWNRTQLISAFGGEANARKMVDFMKEDIKTLGYDGLIILFSGDTSISGTVLALGGDGIYAYNYGRSGEHADYQIATMKNNKDMPAYYVPSVSVGFNAIGRHDERSGMITPEEHRRVCEYIKNEYLPTENNGSWHDNLIIVSTWNEYTEGTYVAPNNLYGFAYLDNIRDVFTDSDMEHEDIIPSEKVKDRLRNIYPDGFSPIRRYRLEGGMEQFRLEDTLPVVTWDFSDKAVQDRFTSGHGLSDFGYRDGVLYGKSGARDFSFATKYEIPLMLDIDETGARYLHIRMKSDVISRGEMFFTTDKTPNYIAGASVGWDVLEPGIFVDYYVDISQNMLWDGILKSLRFDPMETPGSFEVELIELLSDDRQKLFPIYFDGYEMKFDFVPEYNKELDDYMVTLNPRLGFFTMSHTNYEYNYDKKTVYIEGLEGNILFTVGKDTALVNGKEQPLGFTFTLRDGLPFVPIKYLMNVMGFEMGQKDGGLYFVTYDEKTRQEIGERKEGEWEFNRFSDVEGWKFQNCSGHLYDGALNMVTTGRDTAVKIYNLDLDLNEFSKVTVGISYKTDAKTPHLQVFFQTKAMSDMNEAASERIYLSSNDTDGKFVEFTLDFSNNELWKGILTALRIDPYHGMGTYSIDYVRLS